MTNEQKGQSVAIFHLLEQVQDLRLHGHVKSGDRFIANEDLRVDNHRAGDRNSLTLAS